MNKLIVRIGLVMIMSVCLLIPVFSQSQAFDQVESMPEIVSEEQPIMIEIPVEATPTPTEPEVAPITQPFYLIDVPIISQNPELFNGCEVTSLAMLLLTTSNPVDKLDLADMLEKDPTEIIKDEDGQILFWGDPEVGFVGSITGDGDGYGVFHGPIATLLNQIIPGQALDLTGFSFEEVLAQSINIGIPVVVWTNIYFATDYSWLFWESNNGTVWATWREHAVLIVGYDDYYVYVNDPFDGLAAKPVEKYGFLASWEQMGMQAVTYRIIQ